MGLASIIISAATKEIAGFTVIGYLTEKAADIGTGKIWTELKKKIGDRPDSFECRLYGAIEKSVGEYLCKGTTEDVSAAICEYTIRCAFFHPVKLVRYGAVDLFQYLKYRKWNECRTGELVAYVGLFGKGKTLSAVHTPRVWNSRSFLWRTPTTNLTRAMPSARC